MIMHFAPRPRSEWPQCGPQADLRVQAYEAGRLIARLRTIEPSPPVGTIGLPYWKVAEMQLAAGQVQSATDTAKRGLTSLSGDPGSTELEDVVCPTGWEIVAQGDGVVCERCASPGVCEHLPPAYKPSTKGEVDRSPGVFGWSLIVAAGMWITAVFLKRRRGGRR